MLYEMITNEGMDAVDRWGECWKEVSDETQRRRRRKGGKERAEDKGERKGRKQMERMGERGFIEAAGKSSVIALRWIRGMHEKWREERV